MELEVHSIPNSIRMHLFIYLVNNNLCFTSLSENKLLELRKVHSKLNVTMRKGNAENLCFGTFFFPGEYEKNGSGIYKIQCVRMLKEL